MATPETLDEKVKFPSKLITPIEVHVPFLPPFSIRPIFEYNPNAAEGESVYVIGGELEF